MEPIISFCFYCLLQACLLSGSLFSTVTSKIVPSFKCVLATNHPLGRRTLGNGTKIGATGRNVLLMAVADGIRETVGVNILKSVQTTSVYCSATSRCIRPFPQMPTSNASSDAPSGRPELPCCLETQQIRPSSSPTPWHTGVAQQASNKSS